MAKSKTSRYILIAFLLIMLFFTFISRSINYLMTPKVITASVESGYITNEFIFAGVSFYYEDAEKIHIGTRLLNPIYATQLLVNKGDTVDAGDALLVFDTSEYLSKIEGVYRELEAAQTELTEFDNRYAVKIIQLEEEKEKYEKMREYILTGNEYKETALQSMMITLHDIDNTLQSQSKQLTDAKQKHALGIIPFEQVQEAEESLLLTFQKLDYHKKIFNETKDTLVQEYTEKIKTIESELEFLKDTGIFEGKTRKMLQAKLDEASVLIKDAPIFNQYHTVVSPISGVIDEVNINVMEPYSGMEEMIRIVPLDSVPLLKAAVPKDVIYSLKKDDECIVIDNQQKLRGKIKDLGYIQEEPYIIINLLPYNDPNTIKNLNINNVQVMVVKNSDFCNAIIPNTALIDDNSVYLVKKRTGFWGDELYIVKKQIIKGISNGKNTAVVQGLTSNDVIVIGWDRELTDGDTVAEYLY